MAADRWPRPQRCRRALQGFSGLIVGHFCGLVSVRVAQPAVQQAQSARQRFRPLPAYSFAVPILGLVVFQPRQNFGKLLLMPLLRGEHLKEERASTRNITAVLLLHLRDDFALS